MNSQYGSDNESENENCTALRRWNIDVIPRKNCILTGNQALTFQHCTYPMLPHTIGTPCLSVFSILLFRCLCLVCSVCCSGQLSVGSVGGFADDYAYLISALLDLYEASFNEEWIKWAVELQEIQNELFWDDKHGGYYGAASGDDNLLMRMKEGTM